MSADSPTISSKPASKTRWETDPSLPDGLVIDRKSGIYYLRRNFRIGQSKRWDVVRSMETRARAEAVARFNVENGKVQREAEQRRRDENGIRLGRRASAETEGRYWADRFAQAKTNAQAEAVEVAYDVAISNALGEPVGTEADYQGHEFPVYSPQAERRAVTIAGIVSGNVVPVGAYLEDFMKGQDGKSVRYAYRLRRAASLLEVWLSNRPEGNNTRAVTETTALEFLEDGLRSGSARRTVGAFKSALNVYWTWLSRKGVVRPGVWLIAKMPRDGGNSKRVNKRAFTDDEMVAILGGDAGTTLMDMIMISALSGMRRGEVAHLKVADCGNGAFHVQEGKTENAERQVPIHPGLVSLVARRCSGKAPDEYLIEELTAPPSRGARGRGDKMGERFMAYRRRLGVDVRRTGKMQADADFHSLRRWFATKAERAGNPDHIISAVLGHSEGRKSLAMSVYSDGPSLDQWRACVESVMLPTAG